MFSAVLSINLFTFGFQLIKILSSVFSCSLDDMADHLEKGDVAETGRVFYEKSSLPKPISSSVSLLQVLTCPESVSHQFKLRLKSEPLLEVLSDINSIKMGTYLVISI